MPRMKKENCVGLDHAFRFFRKKFFKKPMAKGIDRPLYRNICKDFNKMIVDGIEEGKRMQVPHRLGHLWYMKYQTNYDKPYIDWNETRHSDKTIYHLNLDSDGYSGKLKWDRQPSCMTNLIYYSFKIARGNKNRIVKGFYKPNGHKKYFE